MAVSLTYDIGNRIISINSMTGELNTCEDVVRALSALNATYATTVMSFTPDNFWTGGIVGLSAELRCADNPTCNLTFLSATQLIVDREPATRSDVLQTLRQGSMIIYEGCLLNFNSRKQTNRNMFVISQGKMQFLGTETHRISCESPPQYRVAEFLSWSGLSAIYVDHYNWSSNSVNGRDQFIGPIGVFSQINSQVTPTLTNKNQGWVLFNNCRMYPGSYWENLNGLSGANSWAGQQGVQDLQGAIIKDCYFYRSWRVFQAFNTSTFYLRCTADSPRDTFFQGQIYTYPRVKYNDSYNFTKLNLYDANTNQISLHFQDCVFKDYFLDLTNTSTNFGVGFVTNPFIHLFSNCLFDHSNSFYNNKTVQMLRVQGSGIILEDEKRPCTVLQGGNVQNWYTLFGAISGNTGGYLRGFFTKIKVVDKNNNPIYAAKVIVEQKQGKEKNTYYTDNNGDVKSIAGQDIFIGYREYYGKENTGTSNFSLTAFGSRYWSDGLGDQYHIITAYKEGYEPTTIKAVINDEKEFVLRLLPYGSKIKNLSQRVIDPDANTYIQATNCKDPKGFNDLILALKKENYWDRIKIGWIFGTQYNTSALVTSNSATQIPFKGTGDVIFVDSEMRDYGFYMNQNNIPLSSYAEFPLLGMNPVSGVPFYVNATPLTPFPATDTNTQDFIFFNKVNNVRFFEQGKAGTGSTGNNMYQVWPNVGRRLNNSIFGYASTNNLYTSFSWNLTPSLSTVVTFNDFQQTPRLFAGGNDTVGSQSAGTLPIQDVVHRFAPRHISTPVSSNGACQLNIFLVFNPSDGLKASESFRLGEIIESTLYRGSIKLT
jgi:hypothetical protein